MLNLNIQIGKNLLEKHKPINYKSYPNLTQVPYSFSIGEDGQIVAWKETKKEDLNGFVEFNVDQDTNSNNNNNNINKLLISEGQPIPELTPVYYMISSLNGDQDKCVSLILSPLRLINQQQTTYKIITYHIDNRIRIWESRDGTCVNISSHEIFNSRSNHKHLDNNSGVQQKIVGLVENSYQCRFIFLFSNSHIFIFDCWTMKIVGRLQPKKQVYSNYLKASINQKYELELYDNYHKSYKLNISSLFKQSLVDVGRWINSLQKAQKQLMEIIEPLNQQNLVIFHKTWKNQDYKLMVKKVKDSQQIILKKQKGLQSMFEQKFAKEHSQELAKILPNDSKIIYENLFFIKGNQLYYFVGLDSGQVYGIPAVRTKGKPIFIVKDSSTLRTSVSNPIKYLNLIWNLLIISWDDGTFKVYTVDNLAYMLEEQTNKFNKQNSLDQPQRLMNEPLNSDPDPKSAPSTSIFGFFELNALKVYEEKLSNPIKYLLPIHMIHPNGSGQPLAVKDIAFQLENSEVVIFDYPHLMINHFVGIEQNVKIYTVLYMNSSAEYIGIATQKSIQVYSPDGYERSILYKDWQWEDYSIFSKYQFKADYNYFHQQNASGLELIQYANRHEIYQIEYTTSSMQTILYETFGNINTNSFNNQLYSKFHFLDKSVVQKCVHSKSADNYITVLKHKHNSYRKDLSTNTSFILNTNLNQELDLFSSGSGSSQSSSKTLEEAIQQNFYFYSSFLWDKFDDLPFLYKLMTQRSQQFILKRRYLYQGCGKTFTAYFDTHKSIFDLSKFILTQYAISTISFLQAYVMKQIQKADEMVSVVQYFTLAKQSLPDIYVSGEILSKSIISSNQSIVKASINLLISTIISGHLNLHPLYEYFVLNMKTIQQSKQKQLHQTQCSWLLYLGLGIIYGKQPVQRQQIKMLIQRILQCIDLSNFVLKPDLVQVILKLFNQGLGFWKDLLNKQIVTKLYLDLFKIFFYYDGIGQLSQEDKKFNFCFENNTPQQIKRMKQSIVKTIVYLSKEFNTEFIQCLTNESVSQKVHLMYPASVIQILRQYLKSQKPKSHLVFYIELLLQSLSPMTPNLRKYVQKNVISTLQFMCTYKSISFNQTSQKLSVQTPNHIYIYCLRTSTKWRTISLKQKNIEIIPNSDEVILQMSPKGTYIALLTTDKLHIWRLSSGFWSGVLGAFSQGWSFETSGQELSWQQNESSITVVNKDPSKTKVFRL